jgi:acyl dehydratase
MSVPSRFIFHQSSGLKALGRIAATAATAPLRRMLNRRPGLHESRTFTKTLSPPSADLVRRYLEHLGSNPDRYEATAPPHLFSQWTFDLLSKTLQHLPLPLHEMVNGGCRLVVDGDLPLDTEWKASARLVDIDESPKRIRLHHRIETGPRANPSAVEAHMYNVLVLPRPHDGEEASSDSHNDGGATSRRREPVVDQEAAEVERWNLAEHAGLDFAKLTGDFNPIHWLAPAARAAGFRNTILHGFATMARAFEGLGRSRLGEGKDIEALDVRFTEPLVLPTDVGLYVSSDSEDDQTRVTVGDHPGADAYMIGHFTP